MEGIYTKIVGVTKCNDDGTSRQDLIAGLKPGTLLQLERDRDNEHDENAIAVFDNLGNQLGYIQASVAESLAPVMDRGAEVVALATEITGGGENNYGCDIRIEVLGDRVQTPVSDDDDNDDIYGDDQLPAPNRFTPLRAFVFVVVILAVVLFLLVIINATKKVPETSSGRSSRYTSTDTTTTTAAIDPSDYTDALLIESCDTGYPNSADGVDLRIKFTNKSDKSIKYITLVAVPYNAVGDPVECDIRRFSRFRGRVTGPIESGVSDTYTWDCAWYNSTIVRAEIVGVEIEYMDGSTLDIPQEYIDLVSG